MSGEQPSPSPGVRRVTVLCLVGLIWAAALALVLAVLLLLRPVTAPLAAAVLATALLRPLSLWLVRRGLSRGAAAAVTCVVLVAVVDLTIWIVANALFQASRQIGTALQEAAAKLRQHGSVGQSAADAASGLRDLGHGMASSVASGVLAGLDLASQLVIGFLLALALTFFLLRDVSALPSAVRSVLAPRHAEPVLAVARTGFTAVSGFMRGTTLIAAVDAVFIAVGLLLLGVPQPLGLAALVFVGAYVPYVGAFLSGTVAVLVALGDSGFGTALATLGVVLLVQVVEGTFLQPIIQSRTVSLHPAVVMTVVVAGGALAGVLGALLAVPLAAALRAVALDALGRRRADGDGSVASGPEPVQGE